MDLLSIAKIILKHKLLVVPVMALTLIGVVYIAAFSKPLYETTADYVFVPPPAAPTAAQIAQDPNLANLNTANVFSRFNDQSIIADAIVSRMSSASTQQSLVNAGADARYTVAPISLYGSPEPMVEVLGTGSTAAEALKTSSVVSTALQRSLYSLQRAQGTVPTYMFTALQVASSPPVIKVSSMLRSIVAILGVGVVLLFVLVSVGDAIDKKRAGVLGAGHTVAVSGSAPQVYPVVVNGSSPREQAVVNNNGGPPNGVAVRPGELHLWTPIVAAPVSVKGEPRPVGL
jgi:hypothetical protein